MKKEKPKIVIEKPEEWSSDNLDIRGRMHKSVSMASNCKKKIVAYALVAMNDDGSYHAHYATTDQAIISPMDIPNMVQARLQARVIKSMIDG